MNSYKPGRTVLRSIGAALLLVTAFTFFADSARAEVHAVPASVDRTGSRDVTKELNAFIAGVPDGSTITFPSKATYRVEGVLVVENRNDLTLRFNGSRLVANTDGSGVEPYHALRRNWPRHRPHLWVAGSANIAVHDLTVRGANARGGREDGAYNVELEAQHAIEVSRSRDVTITGCDVSKTYGDGIYVGGSSERVTVRGCAIHHTGRQGVAVTSARSVVIEDNDVYEIRRTAFDLEPVIDWTLDDIRIQRNRVGEARLNFVSGHGNGSTFTRIQILDNVVSGEMQIHMKAPSGTRRGSVAIRGNRSTEKFGSPQALITVIGYDDVTVVGNSSPFDGREGGIGVSVLEACAVDVRGNSFTGVERQQLITYAANCTTPGPDSGSGQQSGSAGSRSAEIRIGVPDLVER